MESCERDKYKRLIFGFLEQQRPTFERRIRQKCYNDDGTPKLPDFNTGDIWNIALSKLIRQIDKIACEKLAQFARPDEVGRWLNKVIQTTTVDCFRRWERELSRRSSIPVEEIPQPALSRPQRSTEDIVLELWDLEQCLRKLAQAKGPDWVAIVLAYQDGFAFAEIAEQLNIPANTVRTRFYRARRFLFECLMDLGDSTS
ncbi:MAG: hypothetical protein GXO54_04950 [Chloroflexi bacterium]|nr:hypothetical protein [Chloroflexota bacterium]